MSHTVFDFDAIIDRSGTGSEKWDRYEGKDIIPLWVADMDFRSPPAIVEALRQRINHGVFGYTHPTPGVTEAVLEHLERDFNWRISPEWLVWLPGLVCGLNVLTRSVGGPGDEVLTFTPIYPPFLSAPLLAQRGTVKVPLRREEGRWLLDPEALERAITPRAKLLLLCNPHNPVGRAWSRDELRQLAEIAERHDLIIGSDDIHAGLILDQKLRHIPMATLSPETAGRTITLLAPSKTYNIPGLGCSYAVISDPGLRRSFTAAAGRIVPHVNLLGFTAAEAAYRQGEGWRQALLAYLRGNRDLVEDAIRSIPGLTATPVEATYLAWIDTRAAGIADPAGFFEDAGVGLSNGAEFDGAGFVRLNFGCRRSLLAEALRRMTAAVNNPARSF